jgi:hypothetical protein
MKAGNKWQRSSQPGQMRICKATCFVSDKGRSVWTLNPSKQMRKRKVSRTAWRREVSQATQ